MYNYRLQYLQTLVNKYLGVSPQTLTNFLGQEIFFGNRHGQNFCYAKTTSLLCFFGFSNRRIYLCGSLKVGSKLLVKYRDKLRYFGTNYKFAVSKPSPPQKREGFKSIINGFPKNAMKLHFDKSFCPFFSKTGGVLGRSPKV